MDGALSFAEKITTDFLGTLLIASMVARVHAYRKDKTPMLFVLLISFVVSIVNWLMLDFQLSLILETAATSCMIGFLVAVLPALWYADNNFSEDDDNINITLAIASLCGLAAGAAKLIRPFP
jgi:K+ transporter